MKIFALAAAFVATMTPAFALAPPPTEAQRQALKNGTATSLSEQEKHKAENEPKTPHTEEQPK